MENKQEGRTGKGEKEEADIVVTRKGILKKGFDLFFETIPVLGVLCKDGKWVNTRVFRLFAQNSSVIRMAYDRTLSDEEPVLDVSDQFTQDEVLLAAKFLVGKESILRTHKSKKTGCIALEPALCTGVMEFLDTLGLETTKLRAAIYICKLLKDNAWGRSTYHMEVDFLVCYLERRLVKDDLYWHLIGIMALDLEKYSKLIEEHCELFREHNVFEQICRALAPSKPDEKEPGVLEVFFNL